MIALAPFLLQGVVMVVDEFYCHHRRDLGPWERVGHPVDTGVFATCLAWLALRAPTPGNLIVYVALGVLSCLVITKDEWEHQRRCDGLENWLHSLLFMLHPGLLIWAAHLWWTASADAGATIRSALGASLAFMTYQIVYWNWWRPRRERNQQRVL